LKSYLIAGALALTLVICGCSEKHDAETSEPVKTEDNAEKQNDSDKYVLVEPTEEKQIEENTFKEYSQLQRTLQRIMKKTY
jgi:nitrous oxide reductase accessory protein NosL